MTRGLSCGFPYEIGVVCGDRTDLALSARLLDSPEWVQWPVCSEHAELLVDEMLSTRIFEAVTVVYDTRNPMLRSAVERQAS